MAKHYDEKKVLRELDKKAVQVNFGNHQLVININKGTVGIGTWGKIDFLVNYCGWRAFVRKINESVAADDEAKTNYKKAKKAAKEAAKANKAAKSQESGKDFIKRNNKGAVRNMFKSIKTAK